MMRQRRIPAFSAAATRSSSSEATPLMTPSGYEVSVVMVSGVPRMCIRTMVQPSLAAVGSMSGSSTPAETSLIMFAPAAMAVAATEAR